jgi:hypothetical protein
MRGRGVTAGESFCERPNQFAIGTEPENLEPGHPSFAEALSISFQRLFLRRRIHGRLPPYIQ